MPLQGGICAVQTSPFGAYSSLLTPRLDIVPPSEADPHNTWVTVFGIALIGKVGSPEAYRYRTTTLVNLLLSKFWTRWRTGRLLVCQGSFAKPDQDAVHVHSSAVRLYNEPRQGKQDSSKSARTQTFGSGETG